jgi:hypothetical protein
MIIVGRRGAYELFGRGPRLSAATGKPWPSRSRKFALAAAFILA